MVMKGRFKADLTLLAVTAIPSWEAYSWGKNNCVWAILIGFIWVAYALYSIQRAIDIDRDTVHDMVLDYFCRENYISYRASWSKSDKYLHLYRVWCEVTILKQNIWGNRKTIRELKGVVCFDIWWRFDGKYITGNKEKNEIAYHIRLGGHDPYDKNGNRINGHWTFKDKSIKILLIQFTGEQKRV